MALRFEVQNTSRLWIAFNERVRVLETNKATNCHPLDRAVSLCGRISSVSLRLLNDPS